MSTGISSAFGWINLTTRLLRFASFGRAAPSRFGNPKGGILRIPSARGFSPAAGDGNRLHPRPSHGSLASETIPEGPDRRHRRIVDSPFLGNTKRKGGCADRRTPPHHPLLSGVPRPITRGLRGPPDRRARSPRPHGDPSDDSPSSPRFGFLGSATVTCSTSRGASFM